MLKKFTMYLPALNIFTVLLSVVLCLFYVVKYVLESNFVMALLGIIVIPLVLLLHGIELKIKRKIPDLIKSTYLVFVFLGAVLGSVVDLYEHIPSYDKIIHFISGIYISWLFVVGYSYFVKKVENKINIFLLFIVSFNAAIALFWEIAEYIMDCLFSTNFQKGLTDTMLDMIMAVLGGMLIVLKYMQKRRKVKKDSIPL